MNRSIEQIEDQLLPCPGGRIEKLEILHTSVSYCSSGTHVFAFKHVDSPTDYWTLYFTKNSALPSLTIWLVKDHAYLEALLKVLNVGPKPGQHVARILATVFAGLNAVFLQSPSRNPRLIGGYIGGATADVVILFHVYKGATRNLDLAAELGKSVLLMPIPHELTRAEDEHDR